MEIPGTILSPPLLFSLDVQKKGAEIKMSSILQSVRATAAKIVAAMIDWPLLEWHINDDETAKSRQIKAADKAKKSLHFSEGH